MFFARLLTQHTHAHTHTPTPHTHPHTHTHTTHTHTPLTQTQSAYSHTHTNTAVFWTRIRITYIDPDLVPVLNLILFYSDYLKRRAA